MARLTSREWDVLRSIARGRTTAEIARELGIAYFTARTHRRHLLDKLDLHSAAQLTAYAIEHASAASRPAPPASAHGLTPRQREIVLLVGRGLTSKQIARVLGLSPATVRKHREHIATRLGLRSLSALIGYARRLDPGGGGHTANE
ncbi:response regulator transcription factor [Luteimonas huabeiensis]|uniref:response regulator transcription factor n=1 Tax=Luteimonas huabeiensis TaxID=1244513 RepID=UPI000463797A|nr:LuxR C-terminal-related transcriptional regulator [Luteimonas huabeiensis]